MYTYYMSLNSLQSLPGSQSPAQFSSNLVGGYHKRSRNTYKRFMRGRKNYKSSVRRRISSSPGLLSRLFKTKRRRR
jgi:hypothetical protein